MPKDQQLDFLAPADTASDAPAPPDPVPPTEERKLDDVEAYDEEDWDAEDEEGERDEPELDELAPPPPDQKADDVVLPELGWLESAPSLDAVLRSPRLSRIAAAVLGAAIGDAMGHPTEFMSMESIHAKYGPQGVKGFELYWTRADKHFAPYTDDTQMAEVVLRSLLWAEREDADLDATMKTMASGFVRWSSSPQGGHRAPGNACMSGCRELARGTPWWKAGGPTAGGCGSVMRAYPFGLVFSRDLHKAEDWAVAHSKLTHGDPIALAASAAMAVGVARVLRDDNVDVVLSEMVAAACRYSPKTAAMMATAIDEGQNGTPPSRTLDRLRAWAAHEAIAAAVYIFARHRDNASAAILEGANTPGDSDSIATLAGALVGARTGLAGLPAEWIADVERSDVFVQLAAAI